MGHDSRSFLEKIESLFRVRGCRSVYAKLLTQNDNSKNQYYLGNVEALNLFSFRVVESSDGLSNKPTSRNSKIIKASIDLSWISEEGDSIAPQAKVIFYPQYPEVRLSGILQGAREAPRFLAGRESGRILFLGENSERKVFALAVKPDTEVLTDIVRILESYERFGALYVLRLDTDAVNKGSLETELVRELSRIWMQGWIPSQKLSADLKKEPYQARNGAGYTLEAELGITPNGDAKPDFLGWEIKQHGAGNAVTLLTPEPDGGIYFEDFNRFMEKFGYPDRNGRENRKNFGGTYKNGLPSELTQLVLVVSGFDRGKISDPNGGIHLMSPSGVIAARWSFRKLIEHWNTKHAKAAYVESDHEAETNRYRYGPKVSIGIGTDFYRFLRAVEAGIVYLDPACKIENIGSTSPVSKRRNQFRIRFGDLRHLYADFKEVDLSVSGGS
jgi:hypothetical protein